MNFAASMKVGLWIALLFSAVTLVKCRPNDDIEHPIADKGHHDHENEDVDYESDAEPEDNGHPHSAAIESKDLKKNTLHLGLEFQLGLIKSYPRGRV